MKSEIDDYKKEFSNNDSKIEALRKQASEKTVKIDELRTQLRRYEESSLQNVFFTPMKTATDNEIKTLSDLVKVLNERISTERKKWDELDTSNKKLKENKKKLQRKIALLNEEIKKLHNMIKKNKGSKASFNKSDLQIDATNNSQSVIKMKSSIGIISLNQNDSEDLDPTELDNNENLDKEEIKFKLEIADEKLKIMEDKLKMLEEEKIEDFNNLLNMIQTSKQLFNEALKVLQERKCHCS